MPFLLAEILNFQGSTHRIGVGSFSKLYFFSRRQIEKILKLYGMQFYSYNERTITKSKDYWNTPKRIYVCWRGENHK